jgi:hypothetical protein
MTTAQSQMSFVLTVAESKRLIAKGVAKCPVVLAALKKGIVAVAKGTTNGYIVEELTGQRIHKPHYCTGTTTPHGRAPGVELANKLPDLVLRDGQRWEGVSATEATAQMKAGDVFIKGANALNYERRQAGILVGHPTGGTIGAAIGTVTARRATLLLPVGLEKSVPGDLREPQRLLNQAGEAGSGPILWTVDGEIFTELEALHVLCGVEARAIGAGGILGAEGSVRIAVWGGKEQLELVESLLAGIYGEAPFGHSP